MKRHNLILLSSIALLALTSGGLLAQAGPAVAQAPPIQFTDPSLTEHLRRIDALAVAAYAKKSVGSLTIGVVIKDQLVWTKSYGYADMEKHIMADKDTVYRIGSVTKMFTAVMLEQLADAGKVQITDAVQQYVPEVNTVQDRYTKAAPATLLELATHTSGFSREPDNMALYTTGPVSHWEGTLIAALPHVHYIFTPGQNSSYSNIGDATLGLALERAAHQRYTDYVSECILLPLGMTHTAFQPNPPMLPHLSKGYQNTPDGLDSATPLLEHAGRGYKVPNGAMYTTVGDLAHFASFFMGYGPDIVLNTASLKKYQNDSLTSVSTRRSGLGLGFQIIPRSTYVALGHGGSVAGYLAAIMMNRQNGVGLIVFTNASIPGGVNPEDVAIRSLDLLSN